MNYRPKKVLTSDDCKHILFGIYRYCLTIRDVRDLLGGVSRETAYFHVRRWIDLGYAYRKEGFILFTQKAFHHCDVPFPYRNLGRQNLEHAADTNTVERFLHNRQDMYIQYWEGERLLRHKRGIGEGHELGLGTHIPDAIAEIYLPEQGYTWTIAIEIERSYKGPGKTDEKLAHLAAYHDHIWYFASESVYPLVMHRIKCMPETERGKFGMWELDMIRIWQDDRFSSRNDRRTQSQSEELKQVSSP